MELVQKNIHFIRMKKEAENQITLEEDVNIPDTKEDVEEILFTENHIVIEEVKAQENKVYIRGKMMYSVLYKSEDTGRICNLLGSFPINEQLYMEGISASDKITVKPKVLDFSVGIINSRKISIQSVIELYACMQDMYDEQITTDVQGEECEILQKECDFTQLTVCKKDILRLRENVNLPGNMPNVEEVIFSSLRLVNLEYKPLDGQLNVQGKVQVFVLYDGERDSRNQVYQTTIPFSMTVECSGCKSNVISQISHEILDKQIHLETDFDGENRSFQVEMVIELEMKLYEPQKVKVLWDLYGTRKELVPVIREFGYNHLAEQHQGTLPVTEKLNVEQEENVRWALLYSSAEAFLEKCEVTDNQIHMRGIVSCQLLFMAEGSNDDFYHKDIQIPFVKTIEGSFMAENVTCSAFLYCADIKVSVDAEGHGGVEISLAYKLMVFEKMPGRNMTSVEAKEMDPEKCNNMPAMAVCILSAGDTLWEIGKKYGVTLKQIREMNQMSSEEVKEGEKILIVRGMCS